MKPDPNWTKALRRVSTTAARYRRAQEALETAQRALHDALEDGKALATYDELARHSGLGRERIRQIIRERRR